MKNIVLAFLLIGIFSGCQDEPQVRTATKSEIIGSNPRLFHSPPLSKFLRISQL